MMNVTKMKKQIACCCMALFLQLLAGSPSFAQNDTIKRSRALQEVVVTGKSIAEQKREAPANVTVLDRKDLQFQVATPEHVINKAMGVRVSEQGGLGSWSRVLVQGLDGKRVGVFVNGISMGSTDEFKLNQIAMNAIERIEIYKGIVPAWLGGEGLGGAINIITKQLHGNHLETTY